MHDLLPIERAGLPRYLGKADVAIVLDAHDNFVAWEPHRRELARYEP